MCKKLDLLNYFLKKTFVFLIFLVSLYIDGCNPLKDFQIKFSDPRFEYYNDKTLEKRFPKLLKYFPYESIHICSCKKKGKYLGFCFLPKPLATTLLTIYSCVKFCSLNSLKIGKFEHALQARRDKSIISLPPGCV